MDFRRECLSHSLSLLMSSFSLVITPPDGSRPGFTVNPEPLKHPEGAKEAWDYITPRSATTPYKYGIRSFGKWLNPRYIFGAESLD